MRIENHCHCSPVRVIGEGARYLRKTLELVVLKAVPMLREIRPDVGGWGESGLDRYCTKLKRTHLRETD
jgi:hypothetical protein